MSSDFPQRRRFRIVSVNDVYSLENLARFRSLVAHHLEVDPADATIIVLAGDFVAPSLLSSIDAGRGMIDCLNAVGITHVVLGNHEDDLPPGQLWTRLAELHAKCLGTNVHSPAHATALPAHDVIPVGGGLTVGLVGVVMTTPTVYRGKPFGAAGLDPANDAAIEEAARLIAGGCSVVVPLTHQTADEDRELAHRQRDPRFPAIIGGHEHVPMLVDVEGTWIVKAGSDAAHAVITEIVWLDPSEPSAWTCTTRLEDVTDYPEDERVRARIDAHLSRVKELTSATLLYFPPGTTLSSVGTRSRETSLGALICSRLRDALGAEACVFNGGGIRASQEYHGRFTYGDVESEIPFDNEVVVVELKGSVVRDAVAASRAHAPAESGSFLQVDDRIQIGEDGGVIAIAGAPIELDREYRVALVRELLLGLDRIEPLVRWAIDSPTLVPPAGSGREPKLVLVQAFAIALWKELGGFDAVDTDKDDRVTASEVAAAVARAHPSVHPGSSVVADLVIRAVDRNADHIISRSDAEALDADPPKAT